jgi:adenosylhomocysteinase
VNLVAAEGNPAAVMDVSFGVQALALAWLASGEARPAAGVHKVPAAIDTQVADLTLAALGTDIDTLTPAQQQYLDSWRQGS